MAQPPPSPSHAACTLLTLHSSIPQRHPNNSEITRLSRPHSPVSLMAHAQSPSNNSPPSSPPPTETPSTSTTPPSSSSSGYLSRRPTFWQTVLAPEASPTITKTTSPNPSSLHKRQLYAPPRVSSSSLQTTIHIKEEATKPKKEVQLSEQLSSIRNGSTLQTSSSSNHPPMNIPCLVCGVRFRKPGHLNMHWRSVHARQHPPPPSMTSSSSSTTIQNSNYPSVYQIQGSSQINSNNLIGSTTTTTSTYSQQRMEMGIQSNRSTIIPPSQQQQQQTIYQSTSNTHRSTCPSSLPVNHSSSNRNQSGPISKLSRAYACPQCDASFRRGSDRNRHMRMVHAKIRPFECTICGNHFGRKSFLEAHVLTVHHKLRPFRCECGAAFGQRSSLTRHARKIHGREPTS